jgi:hypothetical protein
VVLITRLICTLLLSFFIVYAQNYNILCLKPPVNLLSKGFLNGKPFYYFGDIKINELGYRIQFLLDNFDKMNLKTVKYVRKGLIIPKFDPYNSFYHPHFLVELKNNVDNFNNFYVNFQMSTKSRLGFEKLANTNLNMIEDKEQCISPYLRVYATNMIEFKENEYIYAEEFIEQHNNRLDDYVFKNLKEYIPNFKMIE